jgi:hypothetical protein
MAITWGFPASRVGIIGIGLENTRPLGAVAIGLHVDHFLVVPRQRERHLATEIFRCLGVENIGVGPAGGRVQLAGGQAPATGNPLVIAEFEVVGASRIRKRKKQHHTQADLHNLVHSNHPRYVCCGRALSAKIVAKDKAGNHKVTGAY